MRNAPILPFGMHEFDIRNELVMSTRSVTISKYRNAARLEIDIFQEMLVEGGIRVHGNVIEWLHT